MKRIENKRLQFKRSSLNTFETSHQRMQRVSKEFDKTRVASAKVLIPIKKKLFRNLMFTEIKTENL